MINIINLIKKKLYGRKTYTTTVDIISKYKDNGFNLLSIYDNNIDISGLMEIKSDEIFNLIEVGDTYSVYRIQSYNNYGKIVYEYILHEDVKVRV